MAYAILYSKQALKDAKRLSAAGLAGKAQVLIEMLTENPLQTPPRY